MSRDVFLLECVKPNISSYTTKLVYGTTVIDVPSRYQFIDHACNLNYIKIIILSMKCSLSNCVKGFRSRNVECS